MRKGFTLIELLIVITIIGILVVGILAAINPIEQVRRAQDQGIESDASEFVKALDRYYTSFFGYPWDDPTVGSPPPSYVNTRWLNKLVQVGEIKDVFVNRASWSKIYVTQTGTTVYACFRPASNNYKTRADRYQDGSSGCTGTNCWMCLPR